MFGSAATLVGITTLMLMTTLSMPPGRLDPGVVPGADQAATYIVAQDGSGDYATVNEAVAVASAGDTILIRPGTYHEAVVISEDIVVTGDGPREDIIITLSDGQMPLITIRDSEAVLSHLTLSDSESHVELSGGAPTLHDLVFDGVASPPAAEVCHALFAPEGCNPLTISLDGARALVRDNVFRDSGQLKVHGGSTVIIEGNQMTGGSHVFLEAFGDGTLVRGNTFMNPGPAGIAIYTTGRPLIEGNVISGASSAGIKVGLLQAPDIAPIIRGNTISDSATGIEVTQGAEPTIEANRIIGNTSGIVITGSDAIIARNDLLDNANGIFVMAGAPMLAENAITGGKVGIGLGSDKAVPLLSGNTICENETNVNLIFGAEMPDMTGNDVCPETTAQESD